MEQDIRDVESEKNNLRKLKEIKEDGANSESILLDTF